MKKLLSVLVTLAVILSMLPAIALAADGTFSYVDNEGDSNNDYAIEDVTDLKAVRDSVNVGNVYKNKAVKLLGDIDLANGNWTPIGIDNDHRFEGKFDGNGHTISNLTINPTTGGTIYAALFGRIQSPPSCQGGDCIRR